jgi:ATP-dependent RNA helicase DDX6/DHH1
MGALGGTSIKEDILRLENPVHIIVATPGRILDLAEKEVVDLSTVKIIILDEVDKLLSINFMPVTEKIFEYLSKEVQILLFSATYPKETTVKFQKKYIPNPQYVNMMSQSEVTLKGVTQYYAYIEEKEKLH